MSNSSSNNASDGDGDDSRKKRVNSRSEREASKKVRPSEQKDGKTNPNAHNNKENNDEMTEDYSEGNTQTRGREKSNDRSMKTRQTENLNSDERQREGRANRVWDLESALLYLVQSGDPVDKNSPRSSSKKKPTEQKLQDNEDKRKNIAVNEPADKPEDVVIVGNPQSMTRSNRALTEKDKTLVREYLTKEENSWITFRPAHAGDASTIAQWYRRQRSEDRHNRKQRQQSKSSISNEKEKETAKEEVERDLEEPEIDVKPSRSSSSHDEEIGCFSCRLNNGNNDNSNYDSIESHRNFNSSDDIGDEEDGLSSSLLQLEHWLAEGLGDENTCPFVHGLLAYVHHYSNEKTHQRNPVNNDDNISSPTRMNSPAPKASTHIDDDSGGHYYRNHLAGVVLMSLSWTHGKRHLRIEWMSFDSSIPQNNEEGLSLRQKVWLRIHMLSAMTACQAISVDENVLMSTTAKEQPSPSQLSSTPLEGVNDGTPQGSESKKSISEKNPGGTED